MSPTNNRRFYVTYPPLESPGRKSEKQKTKNYNVQMPKLYDKQDLNKTILFKQNCLYLYRLLARTIQARRSIHRG